MIILARMSSLATHTEMQLPSASQVTATVSGDVTWGMKRAKQPEDLCVGFFHFPDLNLSEFGLIPNCFMRHLKLCKQ